MVIADKDIVAQNCDKVYRNFYKLSDLVPTFSPRLTFKVAVFRDFNMLFCRWRCRKLAPKGSIGATSMAFNVVTRLQINELVKCYEEHKSEISSKSTRFYDFILPNILAKIMSDEVDDEEMPTASPIILKTDMNNFFITNGGRTWEYVAEPIIELPQFVLPKERYKVYAEQRKFRQQFQSKKLKYKRMNFHSYDKASKTFANHNPLIYNPNGEYNF